MTSQSGRPLPAVSPRQGEPAPSAERRLRILLLEDDTADAELQARALTAAGFDCAWERVDNERAFSASLDAGAYDVILSDYRLPSFNGLRALQILRERDLDVPFILVSGALGEEAAIESLKLGATDYVLKGRLDRLPAVIRRALRDTEERRQRARAEAALRESEERYRSLVENAHEIIITLAPGWRRSPRRTRPSRPCSAGCPAPGSASPSPRWSTRRARRRGGVASRAVPAASRRRAFQLHMRTAAGDYLVQEITATAQRRGGQWWACW